ncbi:hypothetical protein GLYMA_09G050402v4 [Glycine max]|nr:hypothetical protein GLYMA_09G050402v4 [Glycine max]KAH1041545.1 hypothetical protein GYH30_024082 [Glycine max]
MFLKKFVCLFVCFFLCRLLMRLSQPTVKNMRGTWECIQRVLDAHLTGRMFA